MKAESGELPTLAGRPEATRAAQQVVRMIHSQGMKRGDRVPSQQELCASTGFSNNPMSAAMKVLVANGMLTRKVRVGTLVVEPDRVIRGLWRVAVTTMPAAASQPFFGELFHRIQSGLEAAGCITRVYVLNETKAKRGMTKLEDFEYLMEDLKKRPLDGVLDMTGLFGEDWEARAKSGLIMVHAGSWEDVPAGVLIEQRTMVRESVRVLLERGCRRLAVVSMGQPSGGYGEYWKGFESGMKEAGLAVNMGEQLLHGGEGAIAGRAVARRLLEWPAARRPDGLIVVDDRIAMGLAATLVQTDYRPKMVVQTNLQAPLAFALPVVHFEVDADELASRSVNLLLSCLRNPTLWPGREWVQPRILNQAETHMSMSQDGSV